jgi:hypothetical protein
MIIEYGMVLKVETFGQLHTSQAIIIKFKLIPPVISYFSLMVLPAHYSFNANFYRILTPSMSWLTHLFSRLDWRPPKGPIAMQLINTFIKFLL